MVGAKTNHVILDACAIKVQTENGGESPSHDPLDMSEG